MPGLVGIISTAPPAECQRLVGRMLRSMQHENTYSSGTHSVADLGVFSGWTALTGSFSDPQPLVNERADLTLLVAGECFADSDIIARLRARGHRLDATRAGWLIHLYEEKGDDFFSELNGLFSGLLIDQRQRAVYLFNDRYGIERLYYHEGSEGFFFASEAKALLCVLPALRRFDENGLAQFLYCGATFDSQTLYRGIKLLPPASVWRFGRSAEPTKRRYFLPTSWESQTHLALEPFSDELQATLARVLPRYFGSQGPIGVSLTGGLDTRMIMACRPPMRAGVACYTWAGLTGHTLDAQLAARVAAACELPHHVIRIGLDFFSDFSKLADRTVFITDGCHGVCGAHEIYLNKLARRIAPVRLTGNFGSEILRGVTTFTPIGLAHSLLEPDSFRQISEVASAFTAASFSHPVSFAVFREIPEHLVGVVRAAQSQITTRTPYLDNEVVALAYRAGNKLSHSAEPALRVVRQGAGSELGWIPSDGGLIPTLPKPVSLRRLWARASFKLDYWYGEGMPDWLSRADEIMTRHGLRLWTPGLHKYLHYRQWFRGELAPYLRERLADPATSRSTLYRPASLEALAESHIRGRKNHLNEINAVLTLETIDRLLFRQAADEST
jgi:asparagine synthase (glutamine-hydrolysing)